MSVLDVEANKDVEDMHKGLSIARNSLRLLTAQIQDLTVTNNRSVAEIKKILEANKIAIETIRRIKGLDEAKGKSYEDVIEKLAVGL